MNNTRASGSYSQLETIEENAKGIMQKSFSCAPLVAILMLGAFLASCNTTSTMEVPKAAALDAIKFDKPVNKQASFLLTKVVANLKRGTVIAHFPGGGVKGVDGYFCNISHQGKATIEWGAGSSVLGNWSTELGEIFYDVLSQKGLNIAGDPRDLFGQRETASSAEYLIGARISEVKGNFCEAHHWYDYIYPGSIISTRMERCCQLKKLEHFTKAKG